MIVKTVDSEYPPSAQSLALAKADNVFAWNGYLPGAGIAHGWTHNDFEAIRVSGLHTLAYASGRVDPIAAKLNAAAWGVRGCLDVESSIRADGPWVQAWLDASGFGLYGNAPVHVNRRAAFHILAAYPGHDPGTNWPGSSLPTHGWQWAGSVTLYGANVDRCWFDDAIYGAAPTPIPPEEDMPWLLYTVSGGDATQYVFTGSAVVPQSSVADVAVMAAQGCLKSVTPGVLSAAGHKANLAATQTAGAPVSSGQVTGTFTGSVK